MTGNKVFQLNIEISILAFLPNVEKVFKSSMLLDFFGQVIHIAPCDITMRAACVILNLLLCYSPLLLTLETSFLIALSVN